MRNTYQNYWIRYQNDLEDQFRLDCTEEDVKTYKDAKKCKKVINKLRKSTDKYFNQLINTNVLNKLEVSENMYNRKKPNLTAIIGCILVILAIIACIGALIALVIFQIQHPDMTKLRIFIEYPTPTIIVLIATVVLYVGRYLISRS